jgi:hypothetical protein
MGRAVPAALVHHHSITDPITTCSRDLHSKRHSTHSRRTANFRISARLFIEPVPSNGSRAASRLEFISHRHIEISDDWIRRRGTCRWFYTSLEYCCTEIPFSSLTLADMYIHRSTVHLQWSNVFRTLTNLSFHVSYALLSGR